MEEESGAEVIAPPNRDSRDTALGHCGGRALFLFQLGSCCCLWTLGHNGHNMSQQSQRGISPAAGHHPLLTPQSGKGENGSPLEPSTGASAPDGARAIPQKP